MTSLGTLLAAAALGYAVTAWAAVRLWRNSRARPKPDGTAAERFVAVAAADGAQAPLRRGAWT